MSKVLRSRYALGVVLALLLGGWVGPAGGPNVLRSGLVPPAAAEPEAALHDVVINEWSQGQNGSKEWVELLVVSGPLDLRGWTLHDSNSTAIVTFSNNALWQSVSAGSLIVVYNGGDRDSILPADDLNLSDCIVVTPHNNGTYLSGSWPALSNDTPSDNPRLADAGAVTIHDFSAEPGSSRHPGANQGVYYTGNTAAGVSNAANWTVASYSLMTPGGGNGGVNSAWIASFGCGGDAAPAVQTTTPADGAANVSRLANLSVTFSENVDVDGGWYDISCSLSGAHTAAQSGGPLTFTLDPDVDLSLGDHCTVTIDRVKVHDQDTRDPPDTMAADYTWSFDVGADLAPSVAGTTPANGAAGVVPGANLVVAFSEDVAVTGSWYDITCSSSGAHAAAASGGPQTWTLDPAVDFTPLESCTAIVYAAGVTDQDLDDPPNAMAADYSWSFTVGLAAPPPCGGAYTAIFAIQGSGSESAMIGSSVTTQGIVVGDFQNTTTELSGFFLQDPWTDGDPATSDGIFVASTTAVNVGDHVRLTGTVSENGTAGARRTQMTATSLTVCGTGYTVVPTPVTLPIPAGDTLYLEKYEGMLITWPQVLHVTENYSLGRYGEVVLSSGGRLWQPTNVVLPGAPANTLQAENDRNRIILDDDNLTQNADPIDHPSPGLTASNTVRSGDTVSGLTGCMSQGTSGYTGTDNYRIHPTVVPSFVHANPRPTAPAATGGTVTVASFNVLNYFNGPTFPTSRGADSAAEFARQRNKIIPAIAGLHADVIGLMEIENDGGAGQAIQDLVNGLNALEGAGTYAFVSTGAIGTDEIRVALIYRPARVTTVGSYMVDNDAVNNRPTLAQTFQQVSTGERFSVVVNHFKSKGCPGTGDDADLGDGQSCFNGTRVRQATRLNTWINSTVIPTSGDQDVVIIGDLNAYALEDPITTLTGFGYTNLTSLFEGTYAYSYVYFGQTGYLDHALATSHIVPQVASTAHWHINPDEPSVLDYNVEFKSAGQLTSLYSPDAYRSSDHDPVIIGLYPFDFSDLAASYGTAWNDGGGALRLGAGWTADPTFAPDTDNATDDGVEMDPSTGWEQGRTVRVHATVSGGNGYLAGWFDWNGDGVFAGTEKAVAQSVSAGDNTIDLAIPVGAGYTTPGRAVVVRFRLYAQEPGVLGSEAPTGAGGGGETEDSNWTPPAPTAVKLVSFGARPASGGILLAWETASEHDTVGFHLYRSTTVGQMGQRLNGALIPSKLPGGDQGFIYTWLDDTAVPGTDYSYTLEDVDFSGQATAHGPVRSALWRAYLAAVVR